MLKMTIMGKKLMRATKGGAVCCWGGVDDGCSCVPTNDNSKFNGNFEKWLSRMDSEFEFLQ
jgi:hypothetical protein